MSSCTFCPTHTHASSMTLWLETAWRHHTQCVMKINEWSTSCIYCIVYMCIIMYHLCSYHVAVELFTSESASVAKLQYCDDRTRSGTVRPSRCGSPRRHVLPLIYNRNTYRRWNVANADMQKQSQNWNLKRCSMSFAVEFRWYISWWSVFHCNVSLLSCRCEIKSLAGVSCGSQWWWTREWTCILVQLGIHSLIPQETTPLNPLDAYMRLLRLCKYIPAEFQVNFHETASFIMFPRKKL